MFDFEPRQVEFAKMATVRSPFLVVVFLFITSVLALYPQPVSDFSHSRWDSHRLVNTSQLRIDFRLNDSLLRRDDCDPSVNTECPGMSETFVGSYFMSSGHFAN